MSVVLPYKRSGKLEWWQWKRAAKLLESWVRPLIGTRPYALRFDPSIGSHINFTTMEIVVEPNSATKQGATVPWSWGRSTCKTVEQLDAVLARGYARHEAAHALFTEVYHHTLISETHRWLANTLEDGRIERALGAQRRACWSDFVQMATFWWTYFKLSPATAPENEQLLGLCLLHRWDVLRPDGQASKVDERLALLTPAANELWLEVVPLVEEAWLMTTATEVSAQALEILKLLQLDQPGLQVPPGLTNPVGRSPEGERDRNDPAEAVAAPAERDTDRLRDEGGKAFDSDGGVTLPGVEVQPGYGRMHLMPYQPILKEVQGEIGRLTRELTVQTPDADTLPTLSGGKVSIRDHVRSQGMTPFRQPHIPDVDHRGLAIVLLIDRTGSMGNPPWLPEWRMREFTDPAGRMVYARRATLLIERACAGADIPLAIGLAGNNVADPDNGGALTARPKHQSVEWIRTWDTPHSLEEPLSAIAGMGGDSGAEEFVACLELGAQMLAQRSEPTRLLLYIHDGQPGDGPIVSKAKVDIVRKQGYIVIGIYVGPQRDLQKLEAIFGKEWTIGVDDLRTLTKRLGFLLKKYR